MVSKSLLGQLGPDSSSCKAAATSIEAGSNTSGKSSALQANSMQVMQASGLAKNYVLVVKPVALIRRDEELAHQAQGQQLFGQPAQMLPAGTLMLLHPTLTFLMAPASRPVTSGGLQLAVLSEVRLSESPITRLKLLPRTHGEPFSNLKSGA